MTITRILKYAFALMGYPEPLVGGASFGFPPPRQRLQAVLDPWPGADKPGRLQA